MTAPTKTCSMCAVDLPLGAFYPKKKTGRLVAHCKRCNTLRQRRYYECEVRKTHRYARHIGRKFNLAPGEAAALAHRSLGECEICSAPAGGRRLHLDHCHRSGRVRGLLCVLCNQGVGHFMDDPARLRAAANYLEGT